MLTSVYLVLTMSSNSSASPGLRLPGWLHCPEGFRPHNTARWAPASVEYLWRNTGLNQELFMLSSGTSNFMSRLYIVGTSGGEIFHRAAILLKVFFVMGRREWPGQNPMWRRWLKMSDLLRLRMIWVGGCLLQVLVLVGPNSS